MKRLVMFVMLMLAAAATVSAQDLSTDTIYLGSAPCRVRTGSGSPESVVTGSVCDVYVDSSSGAIYRKQSGTATTTGWVGPSTLSKTDDTNITLTLGGSATTALENPASITVGWTGTLAAARLNSNVVQSISNDTNVTGGISAQNLTLGWTGTLAVGRGGLGVGTLAANGILFGNGTGAVQVTSAGGANSVLTANGGAPAFSATPTVTSLTTTGLVSVGTTLGVTGAATFSSTSAHTGDATFAANAGTSSFVSQTTGWRVTAAGALDARVGYFDEFRAKLFTADMESVLAGSQRITKSLSTVSQTFTCPAAGSTSTLWVKDAPTFGDAAVFVSGDSVVLHALTRSAFGPFTIDDCVGVVTVYADGTGGNAGQQSWTFTRNTSTNGGSMATGTTVAIDQLVQDFGTTGNGYVESTAVDGAAGVNAPYTQIVTWATAPVSTNLTPRCRLGNLKGITSTAEYGLLCGNYGGNAFVRFSDQNAEIRGIPLKLYDGGTETMRLDASVPSFAFGSTLPSGYGTGVGGWMGKDAGAYKFRIGDPAGNRLAFDSTNLELVSQNLTINSSGVIVKPLVGSSWGAANGYGFFSIDAGTNYGMSGYASSNTVASASSTHAVLLYNTFNAGTHAAIIDIYAAGGASNATAQLILDAESTQATSKAHLQAGGEVHVGGSPNTTCGMIAWSHADNLVWFGDGTASGAVCNKYLTFDTTPAGTHGVAAGLLSVSNLLTVSATNTFGVQFGTSARLRWNSTRLELTDAAASAFADFATGTITERGRTTALGEWTAVAFAAGNFAPGVGTWTVQSGDQFTYAYTLVGKTMTVSVYLESTTVTGVGTDLNVAIPGGFTATKSMYTGCHVKDNGTPVAGYVFVVGGGTNLVIRRADEAGWANATNNTSIRFDISFEVQ